jgi:tetratricopeptide (TPR) repeat protein
MDHFRTAAQLDPGGYLGMFLAHGYALLGPKEEAYRILEKMAALSKIRYICAYEVASAYAALGEADRAFEWFHKAVQDRSECLVWAKISPWLDPVRSDPRFESLLRQVGFQV